MAKKQIVLKNGKQSATFVPSGKGFRPEWFRLGRRPMLRFKDHEFLNVGAIRVTEGKLCNSKYIQNGDLPVLPMRSEPVADVRNRAWPGYHTEWFGVDVRH